MGIDNIINTIEKKEIIDLVKELIRIPSHFKIIDQEKQISEYVSKVLKREGIEYIVQKIKPGSNNVIAKINSFHAKINP